MHKIITYDPLGLCSWFMLTLNIVYEDDTGIYRKTIFLKNSLENLFVPHFPIIFIHNFLNQQKSLTAFNKLLNINNSVAISMKHDLNIKLMSLNNGDNGSNQR